MRRFVVVSGCSSGGKSALVAELCRRGFAITEEPGRRIVREELATGGSALPWIDKTAFARRVLAMARIDYDVAVDSNGWVFFDRGLIDAAAALQHLTGEPTLAMLIDACRYHRRVFLAPPWPEIYVMDSERRHGFDAASAEYPRLLDSYRSLGYEIEVLPKVGIAERADHVLAVLGSSPQPSPART